MRHDTNETNDEKINEPGNGFHRETDVVVIGAGIAGLIAAITATRLTATISSSTVNPRRSANERGPSTWSARRGCGPYRTGGNGARHVPCPATKRLR